MNKTSTNSLIFYFDKANQKMCVQVTQGCGNTMPDLFDLVPFHSGQVENFTNVQS